MKKIKILLPVMAMLAVGVAGFTGSEAKVANAAVGDTYNLVTSVSELADGDIIAIVAKNSSVAMSTEQKTNNRGQVTITKSGNSFQCVNNVQEIKLGTSGTNYTFYVEGTATGYLYAASSSKNYLRTQATNNANSTWTISISNGAATIKATGSNTRNLMRYNSSDSLFSCYSSGQQDISIYKKETNPVVPEEGPVEYTATFDATPATFVKAEDSSEKVEVETKGDSADVTLPTADKLANNGSFYAGTAHVTGWKGADGATYAFGATASISDSTTFTTTHVQDETEITIAQACEIAEAAGTTNSLYQYTTSGTVKSVDKAYDSQYGNITVTITDETNASIKAYRLKAAEGHDVSKLEVGSNITVTGYLLKYGTTLEFAEDCTAEVQEREDIEAPANVAYNATTYDLTWDAVEGADSYQLVIKNSESATVVNETLTSTSYNVALLENGTYDVSVTALGDALHNDSEATTISFTKAAPAKDDLALLETKSSLAIGWNKEGGSDEVVQGTTKVSFKGNGNLPSLAIGKNHDLIKLGNVVFDNDEPIASFMFNSNGKENAYVNDKGARLYPQSGNGSGLEITAKEGFTIDTVKVTYTIDNGSEKTTLTLNGATKMTSNEVTSVGSQIVKLQNTTDATSKNRIDVSAIELTYSKGEAASYEVTNAVLRFGAFINKAEIWDKLENVSGYGVAVATRTTVDNLAGDSLTEVLEVYADEKEALLANKVGFAEGDMDDITTQDGSVFFNARLEVPAEEYSTEICAVAYVIVDGEYVFLQEKVSSVVAEAEYYLTQHNSGDEELDADVVGALRSLVA